MQLSVDGGALCGTSRFGTTIFTEQILTALSKHDTSNEYRIYTFKKVPSLANQSVLRPAIGWMKLRVPLEELFRPTDIFLALNQAIPLYTSGKIITFSHGLSFMKYPDSYKEEFSRLKNQLDTYIKKSHTIVVSSVRMKEHLESYNSSVKGRIEALPFGIPFDFQKYKKVKRKNYLLFVGNNQPIKNVSKIVEIAAELKLPVTLVGPFAEYRSKQVRVIESITRKKLVDLYRAALSYVTLSKYESFNLPVLEALSQQCPVVGLKTAIIPEMNQFATVCKDTNEVMKSLDRITKARVTKTDYEQVKRDFSWQQYTEKLTMLYNKE